MNIKKTIFKKYWDILKNNKNDKTHTSEDMNMYYSLFKEVGDEVFIEAVKDVLLNLPYFPRVDELNESIKQAQHNLEMEKWKDIKSEPMTKEEEKELEAILKKYR